MPPPRAPAAQLADAAVAGVRDDPAGRLRLARALYESRPRGSRHLPYRRAMTAFMRWQLRRGLLEPPGAPRPGSPWWRALNEAVLRDIAEACHLDRGRRATPPRPRWRPSSIHPAPDGGALVPRPQRLHRPRVPRQPRPGRARRPGRAVLPQRRAPARALRPCARRGAPARAGLAVAAGAACWATPGSARPGCSCRCRGCCRTATPWATT